MRSSPSRSVVLVVALSCGSAACAGIWGFEAPIAERREGGEEAPDATTIADIDSGSSTVLDVAVDASLEPLDAPLDALLSKAGADASTDVAAADIDSSTDEPASDSQIGEAQPNALDARGENLDAGAVPRDAGTHSDPAPCAGYCAPLAGAGWEGPFEISEGHFGGAPPPPSCQGPYWTDRYDFVTGLVPSAASCTCSCGPLGGVVCSQPVVSYFQDDSCTQPCAVSTMVGASCTSLSPTGCGPTPHFEIGPSTAEGGICSQTATTSVPDLAWTARAHLCGLIAAPMGACEIGEFCVPTPDPQFEVATYCVTQAGEFSCPAGYPMRHVDPGGSDGGRPYYGDAGDNRACSACSCGPPAGVTCAGAGVIAYSDPMCSMVATTTEPDSGCRALTTTKATCSGVALSGGGCVATGGQPTGNVTPTSPYTICCTR